MNRQKLTAADILGFLAALAGIVGMTAITAGTLHDDKSWAALAAVLISTVAGLTSKWISFGVRRLSRSPRVFLSFSSETSSEAHRIAETLRRAGVRVWLADEQVKPGEEFPSAILRAIANSDSLVAVLSNKNSAHMEFELGAARQAGLKVIPVITELGELPSSVKDIRYVDLRAESQAAFQQIIDAVSYKSSPKHES